MGISYRLINTYSTDSGNLDTWGGPHSSTISTASGAPTTWGGNLSVSAFDIGANLGASSSSLLNIGSPFGSDVLNVSALLAEKPGGYSVTKAPVFNWNGDPTKPGFGCENFQIVVAGGKLQYTDALDPAYWGLVRNYEASLDVSAYRSFQVEVHGFQHTNLQLTGGTDTLTRHPGNSHVAAFDVQRGNFDFSHNGYTDFRLTTSSTAAANGGQAAYTVQASANGGVVTLSDGAQVGSFLGDLAVNDGVGSVLDFYDNGGGNILDLTDSNIASNIYLTSGGTNSTPMRFVANPINAPSMGQDVVNLNANGSGSAHIFASGTSGQTFLSGFVPGRDVFDMALPGSSYTIIGHDRAFGHPATMITGGSASYGVILFGISSTDVADHARTTGVGGTEHLIIS